MLFLYPWKVPSDIEDAAYAYMFVVLLGTGATVFYNMISNMLRALGDSKTPLYFLVFSSVLNIILDELFILPLHMGVAGAAWATILSQFLSALLCLVVGLHNYPILHLRKEDFHDLKGISIQHLKTGFPMGFQMSVMCIGQLAMTSCICVYVMLFSCLQPSPEKSLPAQKKYALFYYIVTKK